MLLWSLPEHVWLWQSAAAIWPGMAAPQISCACVHGRLALVQRPCWSPIERPFLTHHMHAASCRAMQGGVHQPPHVHALLRPCEAFGSS